MRGPYTPAELRRVVRYAKRFGIEMFPCIQTLAHLEQVLQYRKAYGALRDTASVLSVKAKGTRDFVASLIESAAAPYDGRSIHVGMDEPWDLGRGSVFEIGRAIDPRELYLGHLKTVSTLCAERKLEPIVWGDFVLGQHAFNGDIPMTEAQWRKLPKNITLDYWDYFSEDEAHYRSDVQRFREHGFTPMVSPALWNWDRFWGLYDKAKRTFEPMLRAAKAEGLRRVLMTMWGDDGQEAPYRSNFPGRGVDPRRHHRARPVRGAHGEPTDEPALSFAHRHSARSGPSRRAAQPHAVSVRGRARRMPLVQGRSAFARPPRVPGRRSASVARARP